MDFFEIAIAKEEVKKAIEKERWKRAAFYKFRIPRKIKSYYAKKMKENLTLENLNKYWGKNENRIL